VSRGPLRLAVVVGLTAAGIAGAAVASRPAWAAPAAKPARPTHIQPKMPPPPAMGEADAKAAFVAKQLMDAMGGQHAWEMIPYIRFDFVVVKDGKEVARFKHWWDKRNMRERVEGPDEKGRVVTAIFSLKDKKGKSFTDGIADTDPKNVQAILDNGYDRWVNDTYWMIMPFKLRDPGTHLQYGGVQKGKDGKQLDVLKIHFNPGVGLTSGDRYTIYVDRQTHMIDHWVMALQGQKPPPGQATWEGWTQIGPVKIATEHRMIGKPVEIRIESLSAPATMDESVFTNARVAG
jgi:hypothetical protein